MAIVPSDHDQERADAEHARGLAIADLAAVNREIAIEAGEQLDQADYREGGGFASRRYAAVLMLDNPTLSAEDAEAQAAADEHVRLNAYMARYHSALLDDDEAENEDA